MPKIESGVVGESRSKASPGLEISRSAQRNQSKNKTDIQRQFYFCFNLQYYTNYLTSSEHWTSASSDENKKGKSERKADVHKNVLEVTNGAIMCIKNADSYWTRRHLGVCGSLQDLSYKSSAIPKRTVQVTVIAISLRDGHQAQTD